ncbi:aminotransferase class V-fold PLP-dependent enzyme [Candidatus Agathobaculum pullicola]|uniref:aminotransferase class V-fold PLP-dependent enzyme n=1 Tax=Candidatus Agathobaculum pullicola TaxID=2838426 RepID=UPI003F8FA3B1
MYSVYLDNAATSFPKPPAVAARMREYVEQIGASVNRGSYASAQQAEMVTLRLRQRLCELFVFPSVPHVVLTPGNTWSINLLLFGALRPGDHCLVSAMEHNAVMRPLVQLSRRGVTFDRIPCDREGRLQVDKVEPLLRDNTRLVVLAHASNVSGTVQDVQAVGEICRARDIPFALDAAQTAGHVPIDFEALGLSALSVPGHKGLLGPQGIGALLLRPDFAGTLEPLVSGGTGSVSDSEDVPAYFPDRLEPGTPNLPGIFGWEAALDYLQQVTVPVVQAHDRALSQRFLDGLRATSGAKLIGPDTAKGRVGVFSLDFPGKDNAEVAAMLEERFGILTRCGLHCAPNAHRTLGTFPRGTVRLSFSWFTTEGEVDCALEAIAAVSAE